MIPLSKRRALRTLRAVVIALAALAGLAWSGNPFRTADAPDPAPLRLPAETRGIVGRLVRIDVDTRHAPVRWHACASPEPLDLWTTPDGRTLIASAPVPGRYALWAWTAAAGQPTEAVPCAIVLEAPPAPDPFARTLADAWAGETAPERHRHCAILVRLFRAAVEQVDAERAGGTVGDLCASLQSAARAQLSAEALPKVRGALAHELARVLPTDPAAPLDPPTRARCRDQFARLADRLAELIRSATATPSSLSEASR